MGAGMAAGLYDAAFSTLGAIYREHARGVITVVTLLGGFASTVCRPLSAYLVEHFVGALPATRCLRGTRASCAFPHIASDAELIESNPRPRHGG